MIARKTAATLCFAAAAALSQSAYAEKGDWLWRVGVTGVLPDSDNHPVVEVDDGYSLSTTISYFFTDNIAIDVLAAWPFSHDIALVGGPTVGETKHLPPTVSLQYHFNPGAQFRPYVGLGVNYTFFFDEETEGALAGTDLSLDSSFGFAAQIGADYMLNDKWGINAELRYIDIETEAKLDGAVLTGGDVAIDPWVFGVSVSYGF